MKFRSASAVLIGATLAFNMQAGLADNAAGGGGSTRSLSFISKVPVPAQAMPDLSTPSDKLPTPAPGKKESAKTSSKAEDKYPEAARLEEMIFGKASPALTLNDRIGHLETAVFKKTFPAAASIDRLKRLHETLLGPAEAFDAKGLVGGAQEAEKVPVPAPSFAHLGETEVQVPAEHEALPSPPPEDSALTDPVNLVELPHEQLEHYAMEALNQARQTRGLTPVVWDDTAYKVAVEHVKDLCQHNNISHFSQDADNPDKRYTQGGGSDAVEESIVALSPASQLKANKATVIRLLRKMVKSQDDRDALLSPDATHFAFSFGKATDSSRDRLVGCAMIETRHGMMHPIPKEVAIGDKIDIEGVILPPYHFQKLTLAYEAINPNGRTGMDEAEEALPYFPPLDYVAFSQKGEHDWEKGASILRMAGIAAAIAGGMIIPPVALAAPLIAMAGPSGEPKPISEIPVHGGIKVQGSLFSGKIAISNNGKAGLYYLTVWAQPANGGKPIAISRRVIVAKAVVEEDGKAPVNKVEIKQSKKQNKNES